MTNEQEYTLDHQPYQEGRLGIIDIGSNSIRLVVYDQQKRSPIPIYNEKVMCALGKGLAVTGVLNPEGVELAKDAIRRFLAMGRNMGINSLYIMATAAIRNAKDGKAFAQYLENTYDIHIDIVSGKREAILGAHGICSSIYCPDGISGDLGGGSLELVHIDDGNIRDHSSILLGSIRIMDECKGDISKMRTLIEEHFNNIDWISKQEVSNFYAIGGSFRALGNIHMAKTKYPLRILHQYKVDAKAFSDFINNIVNMPIAKIAKLPTVSSKRVKALPGAAIIFDHLIQTIKPKTITFSASGIREGYLYEMLSPHAREQDGLLASCVEFASRSGRTTSYSNELYTWMFPLMSEESTRDRRLRLAFCLLCDIALHIQSEYRATWAFERIQFSALTGLTHRERMKLALALYHRYQPKMKDDLPAVKLLSNSDRQWAKLVGSAANLAYYIAGSTPGNLHNSALIIHDTHVDLQLSSHMQDISGAAVQKRIAIVDGNYNDFLSI